MEEHLLYVQSIYDELMQKKENRGISYGELVYLQDLNEKKLNEIENEILEELGEE